MNDSLVLITIIKQYWALIVGAASTLLSAGGATVFVKTHRDSTNKKLLEHDRRLDLVELNLSKEIKEVQAENKKDFRHMDGKMDRIMQHLLNERNG